MKLFLILTLSTLLGSIASFGQGKTILADIGYTEKGKTARAVIHSNVEADDNYTYLDFYSGYGFVLKNEDCKAFARLISNYEDYDGTEEMVSLGTFTTHAATGVSTSEKILDPGKFETTYEKGTEIELKYDGEDLWIHIPETNFLRFKAPAKDIRIFKDYVEAFYKAFNQ